MHTARMEDSSDIPRIPFTADPLSLAIADLALFAGITFVWPPSKGLFSTIWPWYPFHSGKLDELYPSPENIRAITVHIILLISQCIFLFVTIPSLLVGFPIPFLNWAPLSILIVVFNILAIRWFSVLLNGNRIDFTSYVDPGWEPHDDEKWIFVNGVAVGDHWMQSSLDRLARTFRRPVMGIHNRTEGIIFDVFEVIIQRTFGYATIDVRTLYARLHGFLKETDRGSARWKKIVLILHSQGVVEGSLALDWVFATLGQEMAERIEVYTFGSAANHMNSPKIEKNQRVIQHIEHYANLDDWVCKFGILHFRPLPWKLGHQPHKFCNEYNELRDRYVGRVFVRKASGHQLNGNYLDNFFRMSTGKKVKKVKTANC